MTVKVNGGIINTQTLAGSLRYFKMTGPFAWTVSDGSVNLPVQVSGGATTASTYFTVGVDKPVPESAAEIALREIAAQADITIISVQPATYGATTQIQFACSASAFGWGADTDPEDLTAAAPEMQATVQALGNQTVYVSVGTANQATALKEFLCWSTIQHVGWHGQQTLTMWMKFLMKIRWKMWRYICLRFTVPNQQILFKRETLAPFAHL